MTVKEKVLELIREGKYEGAREASEIIGCSHQAVCGAILRLEFVERKIERNQPFKIKQNI